MNNRKYIGRFGNRILPAVFGAMVVLAVYIIVSFYFLEKNAHRREVFARLGAVTAGLSPVINGDDVEYLLARYPEQDQIVSVWQDSVYSRLHHLLREVKQLNSLTSPVYLMTRDASGSQFLFVATSSSEPYYRHTYSHFPPLLSQKYEEGALIPEYKDANGDWISSFSPIKNSRGAVVAIVQADVKLNEFYEKIFFKFAVNIGLTLAAFMILGVLLYRYLKKSIARENEIMNELAEKNHELTTQAELISYQREEIYLYSKQVEEANLELENKVAERTRMLHRSNSFLESSRQELAQFIYRSSHDLKGPVARIQGLAYLQSQLVPGDALSGKITHEAMQMMLILDRLKTVNQIMAHTPAPGPLTLKSLTEKILATGNFAKYPPGTVLTDIHTDCQTIETDAALLEWALVQVLDNALKFRTDEAAPVQLLAYIKDGATVIDIVSQTIVMDDSVAPFIFDMFYVGNNVKPGNGLGLYIAQKVLTKMDAHISCVYSMHSGTLFRICL